MAKISDFQTSAPYDAEYIDIMSILGNTVTIVDAVGFENAKGRGVHVLIKDQDGDEYRVCTHGVAIVDLLTKQEVQDAFNSGETFKARFVQKASQTDRTRKVLKLEDAE